MTPRLRRHLLAAAALVLGAAGVLAGCGTGAAPARVAGSDDTSTPAADPIGERLFLDTRFGKFFADTMQSVNAPLVAGEPVVATVQTPGGTVPGPFAGQAINCRSCHFVTELQSVAGAGNRTYADFTARSPLPAAQHGFVTTPRNSMQMVGTFRHSSGQQFLHFDGEFATGEDLVIGTLTGRNFGWRPEEYDAAVHHIAQVIRGDDGTGRLALERTGGLSYAVLFKGTDARITKDLLLPASQRLDVASATDLQIVQQVALCVAQYFKDLQFKTDSLGRYIGSPYDLFLVRNHLPQQPLAGESSAAYNARLLRDVLSLTSPVWITPAACGAVKPLVMVHARTSCTPAVK